MFNVAKPTTKRLFFQGNSLLDQNLNSTGIPTGKYITQLIYNNIRGSYTGLAFNDFSMSAQQQSTMNTLMTSQFTAEMVHPSDVVVIWEGTNSLGMNPSQTGAQAFALLQTWITYVSQFTSKIIVCTVIARNFAGDAANLMTRIGDYNVLVRANYSGNNLCDLGALSVFDTIADTANTIYYNVDKLHLVQVGQDLVASELQTKITNIL